MIFCIHDLCVFFGYSFSGFHLRSSAFICGKKDLFAFFVSFVPIFVLFV